MASVSEAFSRVEGRSGSVLGVLPWDGERGAPVGGYPNRWVEIAIRTHLPARGRAGAGRLSRNHINVLTADVVVVLPGGAGTASEVRLAVRYGRPVVAFAHSLDRLESVHEGIPVERDLEGVAAFVDHALSRRDGPAQ